MNTQTERILSKELDSGEKLVWSGQPDAKRVAMLTMPACLVGIPFTAFACFWITMASFGVSHAKGVGPFVFFPLLGIPFVLVGLTILLTPLRKLSEAKKTYYGITNKRVLIIIDGKTRTIQAFDKASLGNLVRSEYGNRGDITWDTTSAGQLSSAPLTKSLTIQQISLGLNGVSFRAGFIGISNPHDVERLLTAKTG